MRITLILATIVISFICSNMVFAGNTKQVQELLHAVGCYNGPIDSKASLKLKSAIRCYQKAKGFIVADGTLDGAEVTDLIADVGRGFKVEKPSPATNVTSANESNVTMKAAVEAARQKGLEAGLVAYTPPAPLSLIGRLPTSSQFDAYTSLAPGGVICAKTNFVLMFDNTRGGSFSRRSLERSIRWLFNPNLYLKGQGIRVESLCPQGIQKVQLEVRTKHDLLFRGEVGAAVGKNNQSAASLSVEAAAREVYVNAAKLGIRHANDSPQSEISWFDLTRQPGVMTALSNGTYQAKNYSTEKQAVMRLMLEAYVLAFQRRCLKNTPTGLNAEQQRALEIRRADVVRIDFEKTVTEIDGFGNRFTTDHGVVESVQVTSRLATRFAEIREGKVSPEVHFALLSAAFKNSQSANEIGGDLVDALEHFKCVGPELERVEETLRYAATAPIVGDITIK